MSIDIYDVGVLGLGPAGLATSITCSRLGLRTFMCGKLVVRPGFGESLAPAARGVLTELGVWTSFLVDGHAPCPGYLWSWGSGELAFRSFVEDPRGHGWHLERDRFEQRLLARAHEVGIRVEPVRTTPTLVACSPDGLGWRIELEQDRCLHSRAIVDASGRSSAWARQLGLRRRAFDTQTATVAILESAGPGCRDGCSLVEAVPDGWWYSARLPAGQLAVVAFGDHGLSHESWKSSLHATRYTEARVQQGGYEAHANTAKLRVVSAATEALESVGGPRWRAAGDAALAYDPLAAHGLTFALASGRDAARSLAAELAGDPRAVESYAQRLDVARSRYLAMRASIYAAERRFEGHAFWQRRQAVAVMRPATGL